MTFNPLLNYQQGFQVGEQQKIKGLQNALAGQMQQSSFDPSSSKEFKQLTALDPTLASNSFKTFQALDKPRKQAFFDDARLGRELLESGDIDGFLNLTSSRVGDLEKLRGDPTHVRHIVDTLNNDGVEAAIEKLSMTEQVGIRDGFLSDPLDREIKQAKLDSLQGKGLIPKSVQSSKILDDGTIIQVMKGGSRRVISSTGDLLQGDDARVAVESSRDQSFNRKKELARLSQTIKSEQVKENLLDDQQRAIQKGNIQRLGVLSGTSSGRSSAIKKAAKFKLALESGKAFSGAGRKAAAFIPGVFTSQGEFDQEFNAFSEVAARQQLKASGETRPTDADVKGMKEAMFGVGIDEDVNVQLLDDFIRDQLSQNNELDQLIDASKSGNLSGFTYTPAQATETSQEVEKKGGKIMIDANGNRAMVFPDGSFKEL